MRPVFILDPWFTSTGPNRWRFLIQSLKDLDSSLKLLGSRLFVIKGKPAETFKELFKEWNVKKLTFEIDTEPYSKERDLLIKTLAEESSVEVITKVSHTLYDLEKYSIYFRYHHDKPLTTNCMLQDLQCQW